MPELDYDITQPDYLGLLRQYRPKPDEVSMEAQNRIAKGNAVAEAFRLLIDAAGGSKGANIQERKEPTNAVLSAVDKYWKAKEGNRQEKGMWDKLEAGARIDALKTKSAQEFASQKQKEQQQYTSGEAEKGRTFQSAENEKNRDSEAARLKQQADQFRQNFGMQGEELGFKKEVAKTDAEIKREQIQADKEKVQAMYPYGRLSGLSIADEETDQIIRIPDNMIEQALAFMEQDPKVQNNIGFIKAKFNNLGSTQEVKYLITQNFGALSSETKQKIRALSGNASSFKPQTPTIKTDKGSTMVKVDEPPQQNTISPEHVATMNKIVASQEYTPWIKRAVIYRYLIEQGYDEESAKVAAEAVYQSLIGK